MARMVQCAYLKREAPGLERIPYPGELGKRWPSWSASTARRGAAARKLAIYREAHLELVNAKIDQLLGGGQVAADIRRFAHRSPNVLKAVADLCHATLRDVDILGRLGGEEFAVLLPETDQHFAVDAAERLRETITNARIPLAEGLPVTFSVWFVPMTLSPYDTLVSGPRNRAP